MPPSTSMGIGEEAELEALIEAEVAAPLEAAPPLLPTSLNDDPQYAEVARRAGHRCEYCLRRKSFSIFPLKSNIYSPALQELKRQTPNWPWHAVRATSIRRRGPRGPIRSAER